MNTKIDRDEIKSQLKEGLKHSKKILKNKKGKKNKDLIFTLGNKQFLINRCDVGYTHRHRRNGEKIRRTGTRSYSYCTSARTGTRSYSYCTSGTGI